MALNTLLLILSSLNVAVTTQDASLDTQLAAPVLTSSRALEPYQTVEERVSVHFRDAKVSEVLSWLEQHGVNFVVASGDIPSDATISLNVQNETLGTVVNAIGRALGGHWDRENGVRIFRHGVTVFDGTGWITNSGRGLSADGAASPFSQEVEKRTKEMREPFGPEFQKKMEDQTKAWEKEFGPEFQSKLKAQNEAWAKELGPEFQKKMKAQSEAWANQFGPEFQKKIKAQSEAWTKRFGPEFQKKMQGQGRDWQKQFGPEFQKKWEEQGKQLEKMFGPEFEKKIEEQGKQFQKQFGPEFQRKMDEQGKQLEKMFGPEFQKKMDERNRAMEKQFGPEFEKRIEQQARQFEDQFGPKFERRMNAQSKRLEGVQKKLEESEYRRERLFKSLSSDQQDKQAKRGYIWWDELTPEQHKLLGERPKGKFEMKFRSDDGPIIIRGN